MERHELVIVGGSAGGVQAAICAQKHTGLKDILVIRMEENAMVPCGIPYIYGTLGSVDKNILPATLLGEATLKIGEVTSIDREARTVTLKGGEMIGYNKLIMATGSSPMQPPIKGVEKENVWFAWKNTDYLGDLAKAIENIGDIIVIGGGFIGLEFADECRKMGHKVTVVEIMEHCLQQVCSSDLCIRAEETLKEHGVNVITTNGVKEIVGNGKVESVILQNGETIKCDFVIVGIGVVPNVQIARDAGLEIGPTGSIKVDEYQQTSDPDIFAVGDCAEKYSFFNGSPVPIRLAAVATREAKIAIANLYKPQWRNDGTIGVFSTVISNTAIGMAGLTDSKARELGYEVIMSEAQAPSKHPGTMPDAHPMKVKLVFDRNSGKILGGCAYGTQTAGEVANIIASAIVNGMTMEQLALFPMGTHPWLTASPIAYQITEAASNAVYQMNS